jgi:tyrosyl-tRNA synthetase
MTVPQVRNALRRLRGQRGWTYRVLIGDMHTVIGGPFVSEATVRSFLAGAKVTPRIEHLIRSYLEKSTDAAA